MGLHFFFQLTSTCLCVKLTSLKRILIKIAATITVLIINAKRPTF